MNEVEQPAKANSWWIAVNRSSVAACPFATINTPTVSPTPEQLIGFRTQSEQLEAQKLMLNATIEDVNRYVAGELSEAVRAGRVSYHRPRNPELPGEQTAWMC